MAVSILMIEDSKVDAFVINNLLSSLSADVVCCETIQEALDALSKKAFDCVILDYYLPDGDGGSMLDKMGELGCDVPVLVVTGSEDAMTATEMIARGAHNYFPKKCLAEKPRVFLQCVNNAIETSSKRHWATFIDDMKKTMEQEATPIGELFDVLVSHLCLLVGAEAAFVLLVNKDGLADTVSISHKYWDMCKIPQEEAIKLVSGMKLRGAWAEMFHGDGSVIINDVPNHPSSVGVPKGHPPIHSCLCVPFKIGDIKGGICMANKVGGFSEVDRRIAEVLVSVFSFLALRNERQLQLSSMQSQFIAKLAKCSCDLKLVAENIEKKLS
jgi:CheY-like chemotaxis protein